MNFIQNYLQKRTNIMTTNQDYEFAEQLMNADYDFVDGDFKPDGEINGKVIGKKFFHVEGIFLDLTDRTLCHPKVPFRHEDRGGMFANLVKEFGFGNRRVVWQPSDLFNLDEYFEANWFPDGLEMYRRQFNEMIDAKDLYSERRISFLEYFFKRLDIYLECEMPTVLKYYEGVNVQKYKDKIRKITYNYPYLNNSGDLI